MVLYASLIVSSASEIVYNTQPSPLTATMQDTQLFLLPRQAPQIEHK
jgi:hypothetical protein